MTASYKDWLLFVLNKCHYCDFYFIHHDAWISLLLMNFKTDHAVSLFFLGEVDIYFHVLSLPSSECQKASQTSQHAVEIGSKIRDSRSKTKTLKAKYSLE